MVKEKKSPKEEKVFAPLINKYAYYVDNDNNLSIHKVLDTGTVMNFHMDGIFKPLLIDFKCQFTSGTIEKLDSNYIFSSYQEAYDYKVDCINKRIDILSKALKSEKGCYSNMINKEKSSNEIFFNKDGFISDYIEFYLFDK